MTMHRPVRADRATEVFVTGQPDELDALHRPGIAAVIWRRQPLASFQDWIDGLAPSQLPAARLILRPGDARRAVTHVCEVAGTPDGAERVRLIDDIAALADIFADVTGAAFLRVRLDVIETNACSKFHIDAVTARLLCTYRGQGTQYGEGRDGADPDPVHDVATGVPMLLRGSGWRGDAPSGLLHRSPPIAGSGETRLLLVLDPVRDPSDDA